MFRGVFVATLVNRTYGRIKPVLAYHLFGEVVPLMMLLAATYLLPRIYRRTKYPEAPAASGADDASQDGLLAPRSTADDLFEEAMAAEAAAEEAGLGSGLLTATPTSPRYVTIAYGASQASPVYGSVASGTVVVVPASPAPHAGVTVASTAVY